LNWIFGVVTGGDIINISATFYNPQNGLISICQSSILSIVVVLRKLEMPVAGGTHAWVPFVILFITYGVTFEEIVAIYYFDEVLKLLNYYT
jgi:hypothetical protein